MEGVDQSDGNITSAAFGSPTPRPPNQKAGIPPSHHDINIPPSSSTLYPQNLGSLAPQSHRLRSIGSSHYKSVLTTTFSLDSLPPLSPSLTAAATTSYYNSVDLSMKESMVSSIAPCPSDLVPLNKGLVLQVGHSLPPRKGHRRSSSGSPLAISSFM